MMSMSALSSSSSTAAVAATSGVPTTTGTPSMMPLRMQEMAAQPIGMEGTDLSAVNELLAKMKGMKLKHGSHLKSVLR